MEDNKKTINYAAQVVRELQEECEDGVIKDYEIPPLVNMRTSGGHWFCCDIETCKHVRLQ